MWKKPMCCNRPFLSDMLYFPPIISSPSVLLLLLKQIDVPMLNVHDKRNTLTLELMLLLYFTEEVCQTTSMTGITR